MVESAKIAALRRVGPAAPGSAAAWRALGEALQAGGRTDDALAALLRAEALAPADDTVQRALAMTFAAAGRPADATAAHCAALAFAARAPLALFNLATTFFRAGHYEPAAKWYRCALAMDPALIEAHQNLAVILDTEGHAAEARRHRDAAFERRCLFVEAPGATASLTVLILAAAGIGNVPVDFLLPRERVDRITWFIDYATDDQAATLPPFDLVFNAIGDPDVAAPALERAARLFADEARPVLNPPSRVLHTRRDHMPALLAGIDDLDVPAVVRLDGADVAGARLWTRLDHAGVGLPVLLRPVGSHGGQGVIRIETAADAPAERPAGPFYATAYRDYRSADGRYRKYRMIFVDRQPYPYHLAISDDWLVHYFTADMVSAPWKRAEEERFLADPAAVLGPRALAAVAAIGRRLDLDYGGVDFSILPDGRVLFFEANALMLVHLRDPPDMFGYKHAHVPQIFRAFETMVAARLQNR